jgi:hypothetical protein
MTFDHDLQVSKPWFYENYLIEDDITIQLAPGQNAAIDRIDFPAGSQKNILISGNADMEVESRGGSRFAIKENHPYVSRHNPAQAPSDLPTWVYGEITDLEGNAVPDFELHRQAGNLSLICGPHAPVCLTLKYALSYLSADQAEANFVVEDATKNLPTLSAEARSAWKAENGFRPEWRLDKGVRRPKKLLINNDLHNYPVLTKHHSGLTRMALS